MSLSRFFESQFFVYFFDCRIYKVLALIVLVSIISKFAVVYIKVPLKCNHFSKKSKI